MYPTMSDQDRLKHLLIELEWADRRHPEFIRRLRDPKVWPAQAATNCATYVRELPPDNT